MRVAIALTFAIIASSADAAQNPDPGRVTYASRCAGCHGTSGDGGELGPSITMRLPARTDEDLKTLFREGLPMAGMPAFPALSDAEVQDLIRFVRTLRPREGSGPVRTKIALTTGTSLEGLVLNQGPDDLQLLTDDRKIHLLRTRTPFGPHGHLENSRGWRRARANYSSQLAGRLSYSA